LVIILDNKVINLLAFYIITKDSSSRLIYRSQQTVIVSLWLVPECFQSSSDSWIRWRNIN